MEYFLQVSYLLRLFLFRFQGSMKKIPDTYYYILEDFGQSLCLIKSFFYGRNANFDQKTNFGKYEFQMRPHLVLFSHLQKRRFKALCTRIDLQAIAQHSFLQTLRQYEKIAHTDYYILENFAQSLCFTKSFFHCKNINFHQKQF